MIKNIINTINKWFIPLIIKRIYEELEYKFLIHVNPEMLLFSGRNKLFLECISKSSSYVEYGCGVSTLVASKYINDVTSIDSSIDWINYVKEKSEKRLSIIHVNIGDTKNWGYPQNYSKASNFYHYANAPWENEKDPDLVLIDGRFRSLCFLLTLKNVKPGTMIIFDDYYSKPSYSVVESIVKPNLIKNNQALFIVCTLNDDKLIFLNELIEKLNYVTE